MRKVLWLALLATVLVGCSRQQPAAPPAPSPCDDAEFHAVTFTNASGTGLTGYVAGTGATGVVLANQVGATSCTWQPYVHKLVDRGYRVIAFDFAEDAGQSGTVTEDVTAAVAQLRKAGAAQVVLIGASRGGSASIAAAAAVDPPVLGAVSVSGPSIYDGANALAAAPKLAVPVLFLAGELDGSLPTDAQTLYDRTPGGQKKLVIIAGSRNHGQDFPLGVAQGATEANAAIDAFLGQYAKA